MHTNELGNISKTDRCDREALSSTLKIETKGLDLQFFVAIFCGGEKWPHHQDKNVVVDRTEKRHFELPPVRR